MFILSLIDPTVRIPHLLKKGPDAIIKHQLDQRLVTNMYFTADSPHQIGDGFIQDQCHLYFFFPGPIVGASRIQTFR
jgi:hypothetical protein